MSVRVLVVDDDPMVAAVNRGFVGRVDGFTVVGVAATGQDALDRVDLGGVDLVLLDVHLPDLVGTEVLRRLRESSPDVDVLMVTAAREVDTVQAAVRGGAVSYLLKPFTAEDLRVRLLHYREVREHLSSVGAAEQSDVDRAFTGPREAQLARGLPKGLSRETAQRVEQVLRAAGEPGLSASECAEALGASRVSARRYLEHHLSTGQAVVHLRYGTTGRPERRYTWRT
ncbi:response regulator [Geodermatophilus sp. Leaf369]|uniref:response regulator n=1 Tax=Geodermatophilus sp. Leaf369 TaxID=1736354 RepID=UPI0009E93627|nr:response regulator [Geodermatophilus sp. Leaf369]QNG36396.1 response regulator [Geodermatophilaceae bacterium NBWT11]